jgi:short-subunit dehydrogenase
VVESYFATKHAVVALSESLHHELAAIDSPVRVSVACPGMVRTRIYEAYRNWPARYGPQPEVTESPTLAGWRVEGRARVLPQ